jgi:hypothetical protein
MKRREFIAVVGGAAVWWPLGVHGQAAGEGLSHRFPELPRLRGFA